MKKRSSVVLGLVLAIAASSSAVAGDKALSKVLKEREGRSATLILASGTELTGKVLELSEHSVRLGELSGKEFYDAVIDLDQVQAVVFRAREK